MAHQHVTRTTEINLEHRATLAGARPSRPSTRELGVLAMIDARLDGCTCSCVVEILTRRVGAPRLVARHDPECPLLAPGRFS